MTFQPVIPTTGYAGWVFLKRTMESQQQAWRKSPDVNRDIEYFRETISKVKTAEDLVNDRRLLSVALGAFGLEEDIYAKAFILKILEEGTLDEGAFANRLADKRYATMARVFGFGDLGARTNLSTFPDQILSRYETRAFARAVGDVDPSMRLALNLETGLADLTRDVESDTARWFGLMGSGPLREVFETALGLPAAVGALDLDKQLDMFRARARATFGTDKVGDLAAPDLQERIIRLYLIRDEARASAVPSAGAVALTLLQSARPALA